MLGEAAEPATLKSMGVPAKQRWAAMSTISMGWLSATGIMQHLAYRLTNEVRFRAGARDDTAEFSRGTRPQMGSGRRAQDWHDVYLDDNLICELVEEDEAEDLAGTSAPLTGHRVQVRASGRSRSRSGRPT